MSACIHQSAGHAAPAYAVHEVLCRSIINRSRIPGLDYTLNPYVGCAHGCVFCYARFMTRYTQHNMDWGRFVDVKINAPDVLAGQIGRLKPGVVSLSTVTDPYQPVEKKYRITRKLLEMLVRSEFSVHILTRSGLVCRDLDLLKQLPREGPRSTRSRVPRANARASTPGRHSRDTLRTALPGRRQAAYEARRAGLEWWLYSGDDGRDETAVRSTLPRRLPSMGNARVARQFSWPCAHPSCAVTMWGRSRK